LFKENPAYTLFLVIAYLIQHKPQLKQIQCREELAIFQH
jgi:hypothetical protein